MYAYYTVNTDETNIDETQFEKIGEFNFKVQVHIEKESFLISHAEYDQGCTSMIWFLTKDVRGKNK
jgi:hypothetical protein